jgi:hypothetical protein
MDNILDFDQTPSIEVKLGGRSFVLTQQRTAIVQAVLEASSVDVERQIIDTEIEGSVTDPKASIQNMFSNWPEVIKTTALMLGVEQDQPDYDQVIVFLDTKLNPARVISIFEKWWEVNEIESFFMRGGRTLMPRETLERMRAVREEAIRAAMDEFLAKAQQDAEPEGLAGTPPPTVN